MLVNDGAVKIEIKDMQGNLKMVFLSDDVEVGLSRKLIPVSGGRKRNAPLFLSESNGQDFVKMVADGIDGRLFILKLMNNGQKIISKNIKKRVGNLYKNNSMNGHTGEVIEVYEFKNDSIGDKVPFIEEKGVIKAETACENIYVYTELEQEISELCMNASSTELYQMVITCRLSDSDKNQLGKNMEISFKKGYFENMMDVVFGNMTKSEKEIVYLPTAEPEVFLYG